MRTPTKDYVVAFFQAHPRQDMSREEIISGVMASTKCTRVPGTIDRAISSITEFNKDGIIHLDILRMRNGKFRYDPKSATLEEFLE